MMIARGSPEDRQGSSRRPNPDDAIEPPHSLSLSISETTPQRLERAKRRMQCTKNTGLSHL
jgi:hypothetical protein